MKHLESLDFFGERPSWTVKGSNKSFSYYGLFFSLIVSGFFIWFSAYLSRDMFQKTNPTIVQSTLDGATFDDVLEVNPTDYPQLFGLRDYLTGNYYIDDTIYSIEIVSLDQNQTKTVLDWVVCDNQTMVDSYPYSGDMFCLKDDEIINTLSPFPSNFKRKYNFLTGLSSLKLDGPDSTISVSLKACSNSTENGYKCKPEAEIDQRLKLSGFYYYYRKTTVSVQNYKQPLSYIWYYVNFAIVPDYGKQIYAFLEITQVDTDAGWILTDTSTKTRMNMNDLQYDMSAKELISGNFLKLWIYNNGNITYFTRVYAKVQDVIAQVMAVFSLLIYWFGFIVLPYSRLKFYEGMANEAFDLESEMKKLKKGNSKNLLNFFSFLKVRGKSKIVNSSRLSETTHIGFKDQSIIKKDTKEFEVKPIDLEDHDSSANTSRNEARGTLEVKTDKPDEKKQRTQRKRSFKVEKITENNSKYIELTFLDWASSFIKFNPKTEIFKHAKSVIEKQIDLMSILKKNLELETLKLILLDEDETVLFDSLDKVRPCIGHPDILGEESPSNSTESISKQNASPNKKTRLQEVYKKLRTKDALTKTERKLIDRFELQLQDTEYRERNELKNYTLN